METFNVFFLGCKEQDNHEWKVKFAFFCSSGYAGQGTDFVLEVQLGDTVKFGKGFKSFKHPSEEKKWALVEGLQFVELAQDYITLRITFKED